MCVNSVPSRAIKRLFIGVGFVCFFRVVLHCSAYLQGVLMFQELHQSVGKGREDAGCKQVKVDVHSGCCWVAKTKKTLQGILKAEPKFNLYCRHNFDLCSTGCNNSLITRALWLQISCFLVDLCFYQIVNTLFWLPSCFLY